MAAHPPGTRTDAPAGTPSTHTPREDSTQAPPVPKGGLNEEIGDLDAPRDPENDQQDDEDGLPGRAGGGLIGG